MPGCLGCGQMYPGVTVAQPWPCPSCGRVNTPTELAAQAMLPPRPAPPPLPLEHFVLTESRPCLQCGYDLKGLASSAHCPECGTRVERSLRGNLLEFASPDFLRTLQRGTKIIFVGMLVHLAVSFVVGIGVAILTGVMQAGATGGFGGRWLEITPKITEFLTASVVLTGWWLLSQPDPGQVGEDTGAKARKWLRIFLIFEIATTLTAFAAALIPGAQAATASFMSGPGSTPISPALILVALSTVATVIASSGRFFAAVGYLRSFAPRVPDMALLKQANRNLWLLPLLNTVGILACGMGPLVAVCLFLIMLRLFAVGLAAALKKSLAAELAQQAP